MHHVLRDAQLLDSFGYFFATRLSLDLDGPSA